MRLVALGALLLVVGCGGDDEKGGAPARTEARRPAATTPTASSTTKAPQPAPKTTTGTSPESTPGGGVDEEATRVPAIFTGRAGRIAPKIVRVPAALAIRVELHSADGRPYALDFEGKALHTGPTIAAASATLAGLRRGRQIVGRPIRGQGNAVRIEATAKPGP